MIIKEYKTIINSPIPIIDIEIGNDISPDWDYKKCDIITLGILYGNDIIILQREKSDDLDSFKKKIKELLIQLPTVTPYSFNYNMEFGGINGFLEIISTKNEMLFGEIKTFRGKGWNKNKFFEELQKLIKVEDVFNDKLNGDSGKVMQKYKEEKYDDIISHNHSCLIKEAYILIYNNLLWKKFKNKVNKDGWYQE